MVEVRNAIKKDIPAIVEFQKCMALETEGLELDEQKIEQGVKAVFKDENKGFYIVSTFQLKIIASMLITTEWSDWRNGYFLWIQSLYVVPEFRNKGIFKAIYKFIQNVVFDSPEYLGLRLYVEKNNMIARNVYNKTGMDGNHYKMFEWIK